MRHTEVLAPMPSALRSRRCRRMRLLGQEIAFTVTCPPLLLPPPKCRGQEGIHFILRKRHLFT